MRTNIEINDSLLNEAMELTALKTKKDVIHQALELLVLSMRKSRILKNRGKFKWEGNLEEMRSNDKWNIS